MVEKQIYNLQIDEHFKQLIPPLASNEQKQLEENIVNDGCREPLCVWENTIIDGHNRYEICTRLKIPFHIQQVNFNNKDEAIAWICANQLGRRNISEETRKYLIGKRYETEKALGAKNPLGKNQFLKKEVSAQIEHKYQIKESVKKTAERLGNEYHISQATVRRYGKYAQSIDNLGKSEYKLPTKILEKRINKKKVTVKDMPAYDPDAEISSLTLTIPSWISSIDRTLSIANFNKISNKAKTKLQNELKNLEYTVNTILLAVEEK